MPVIDDVRENTAKMKGRSLKDKFLYFWEYYKVPTVIIIFLAFVIISIIKAAIANKPIAFEAIYVNAYEVPDATPFAEKIGVDLSKNQIVFDGSFSMSSDRDSANELTYTSAQKIVAVVAAAVPDVMLSNKEIAEQYFNSEFYADLREYFSEEELNALGDKVIWAAPVDYETGEKIHDEIPMAIDVTDAPRHTEVPCYYANAVYFSVFVNTKHPELVKPFYEFLYYID